MAITKLELADHLHKKMGLPKKDCLDFVNSFFAEISNSLEKGDEVVMTSGLLGKIVKVDGDYLLLKVTDNTELKFQRIAVHAVLPKGTLKAI